jgi:hypothetical protein
MVLVGCTVDVISVELDAVSPAGPRQATAVSASPPPPMSMKVLPSVV